MLEVEVSFPDLQCLVKTQKSFVLLATASWRVRQSDRLIDHLDRTLLELGQDGHIVRWSIDDDCDSDDPTAYAIDQLELNNLPSIVIYDEGIVSGTFDLSGPDPMQALFGLLQMGLLFSMQHNFTRYEKDSTHFIANCLAEQRTEESESNLSESSHIKIEAASRLAQVENREKEASQQEPIVVFLSGDRSSVGKSSTCLAILSSLLRLGIASADLGYIKPVTQCEAEQPVTRFCDRTGIAQMSIGPVVFYQGFTRAFLRGDTDTSVVLIRRAVSAVREIGRGKKVLLVDGVGYPGVGSICGVSNADVASALDAPVLLVGKSGVGDAVDSYNLNAAFFQLRGVRVLGGVFNKLPLTGFYSLEACREAVSMYFAKFKDTVGECAYGFVPIVENAQASEKGTAAEHNGASETVEERDDNFRQSLTTSFLEHVDIDRILYDAWMHKLMRRATKIAPAIDPQQVPSPNTLYPPRTPLAQYPISSHSQLFDQHLPLHQQPQLAQYQQRQEFERQQPHHQPRSLRRTMRGFLTRGEGVDPSIHASLSSSNVAVRDDSAASSSTFSCPGLKTFPPASHWRRQSQRQGQRHRIEQGARFMPEQGSSSMHAAVAGTHILSPALFQIPQLPSSSARHVYSFSTIAAAAAARAAGGVGSRGIERGISSGGSGSSSGNVSSFGVVGKERAVESAARGALGVAGVRKRSRQEIEASARESGAAVGS